MKCPGSSKKKSVARAGPINKLERGAFVLLFQSGRFTALSLISVLLGVTALAGSPPNEIQFTDITDKAGINFKHVASPEKKYIVESMSGGLALIDYNNDGYPDIYFVNSLTVDLVKTRGKTQSALYRNNGDGSFTDVTDKAGVGDVGWGMGVAVGDFDNDGFDDLYVTCLGPNYLFRNNGNGTFTDVTERARVGDPHWSTGAAFVDYDNDGKLDLFVANYVDFDINHLPEFGKGKSCQFKGVPVQCGPRGLPGAGDTLYHNNGDGTFTDVSKKAGVSDPQGYYGMGVICSDFDGDGYVDIYVANDSTPNFLYKNNGDGTFKDVGFLSGSAVNENGSEQGSMGVTVGDYDHDGKFDIFVTNFDDEYNTLYRGAGPISFADISYAAKVAAVSLVYVGWGTKFFDYDNDGWLDLFVANGHVYPQLERYRQRKLLHRNNRDGTFTETAAQSGTALMEQRASRGVAFGDLDNDGDVDLVINDLDGPPQLLRNDGGNANNSIVIKTIGVKSNRDGIGARVRVVSSDLSQVDEVRSGGSYISQNDLRLHFGLERRTKIDLIEIRWPSGGIDKITNATVNKLLTVKEGQGIVNQRELRRPTK
ncbi:MAG: enediyne biosynthesis protein [Acidobacteriota bacterium]|nr:enediyne biosynthesis protein [Acidobacteriota bacterium]